MEAEQLASLIGKFSPEIAALAQSILARMRERYPTGLELVYDNYNAPWRSASALPRNRPRRSSPLRFFPSG